MIKRQHRITHTIGRRGNKPIYYIEYKNPHGTRGWQAYMSPNTAMNCFLTVAEVLAVAERDGITLQNPDYVVQGTQVGDSRHDIERDENEH
jgi:hypothetical protein